MSGCKAVNWGAGCGTAVPRPVAATARACTLVDGKESGAANEPASRSSVASSAIASTLEYTQRMWNSHTRFLWEY